MATIYTESPAKVTLTGITGHLIGKTVTGMPVIVTPDEMLACVTKMYAGEVATELSFEQMEKFNEDIKRTKLQTPLRFINTVWLLEDVTRAFTHQCVRYQIGISFVQESMRFVAKRNLRVYLNGERMDKEDLIDAQEVLDLIERKYNRWLQNDVPVEDARGILPTNVLTNIWVSVSLQALAHIYNQRWCCQAQEGEWRGVLEQMKDALNGIDPLLSSFLQPPTPGHCGFGASFDRPCRLLNDQQG